MCSILLCREFAEPLDTILFSEVMYDKEAGISGEDPRHIEFIKNVAIPKLEDWGYEVKILRSERDYLDVFHRVIERPRKHLHHAGMKYGIAISRLCSVKRDCKMKPINDYYNSLNDDYVEYWSYVKI